MESTHGEVRTELQQLVPVQPAAPVPAAAPVEAVLVQIGEISVTEHWLVTPSGTVPLRRTQFQVQELVTTQERIPPHAIVLAIIFAWFCLIGLLFLLIKERVTSGVVTVTVTGPESFQFTTSVPATSASTVVEVRQQVQYARDLVHRLG